MKNKRTLILAAILAVVLIIAFWGTPSAPKQGSIAVLQTEIKGDVNSVEEETAAEKEESDDLPQDETAADNETPLISEEKTELESIQNNSSENDELTCILSVRCDTVLNNMTLLKDGKEDIIPKSGVIFAEKQVKFNDGESVFNVLVREMKLNKIHLEFTNTPIYNSVYIEGIGNLYEFDCGELSGWMYKVNGIFPNYSCSEYKLKNGDKIEWVYSCDLGSDVGGQHSAGNGKKYETQ